MCCLVTSEMPSLSGKIRLQMFQQGWIFQGPASCNTCKSGSLKGWCCDRERPKQRVCVNECCKVVKRDIEPMAAQLSHNVLGGSSKKLDKRRSFSLFHLQQPR